MDKPPLTKKGFEFIKSELHELKTKARPEISQAIAEARAHGDLKENAEYHAAKEQQALLEKKISTIESILANCIVIDVHEIPYSRIRNLMNINYDAICQDRFYCGNFLFKQRLLFFCCMVFSIFFEITMRSCLSNCLRNLWSSLGFELM